MSCGIYTISYDAADAAGDTVVLVGAAVAVVVVVVTDVDADADAVVSDGVLVLDVARSLL